MHNGKAFHGGKPCGGVGDNGLLRHVLRWRQYRHLIVPLAAMVDDVEPLGAVSASHYHPSIGHGRNQVQRFSRVSNAQQVYNLLSCLQLLLPGMEVVAPYIVKQRVCVPVPQVRKLRQRIAFAPALALFVHSPQADVSLTGVPDRLLYAYPAIPQENHIV